jgi:hypothetical protein
MSSPSPIAQYQALFCPRIDDYAHWDDGHWSRAFRPLTPDVIAAGLAGRMSISTYMADADGWTHVCALDFDLSNGLALAQQTALALWAAGIPAYVEPSRDGRAHLWISLDARIRASAARRFLTIALWTAGVDPDDSRIERFPKQDAAPAPGKVGSCLRLPMTPNPKNGIRYPLLDPRTMEPLGMNLDEIVAAVCQAPAAIVVEIAGPDPEPAEDVERSAPEHIQAFNETYTVSEVLEELWGVEQAEAGRSIRCPAHDDVHPSLSIYSDDRRVLCYAPDCDFHNDGQGRDAYDLLRIALTSGGRP